MKKIAFILTVMLLITSSIFANTEETPTYISSQNYNGKTFNYIDNNVHFQVFQDGEFDFFIAHDNFNVNFDFGAVNITYNSGYNYDTYIQYDDYGAIIQIENTPIYYDYYGRVNRIGNTYIHYNNRRIVRFGGLYVHFNSYGYYNHCTGYINRYNRHYVYQPYFNYYARPHFDFCVVSYRPYRQYYQPQRHRFDRVNRYRRLDSRSHVSNIRRNRISTRKSVPQRVVRSTRNSGTRTVRSNTSTRNSGTRTVRPNTSTRNSGTRAVRSNTSTRNSGTRTVRPNTSTRNSGTRTVRSNTPTRNSGTRTVRSNTPTRNSGTKTVRSNTSTRNSGTRSNRNHSKRSVSTNKSRNTKRR